MARYLIIGAGRFGQLAWQRLRAKDQHAQFCVVDHNPNQLARLPCHAATRTVLAAGPEYLVQVLAEQTWPDWIIPAAPVHLAFAWLLLTLPPVERWQQLPVPLELGQNLPFVQRGPAGEVYLSLATGRCPDDCPEPAGWCSLTGEPRIGNLYDMLAQRQITGYQVQVLRSRQLAPGVGGYRPLDLVHFREEALRPKGKLILCTACRCHGVCHGVQRLTGREPEVGI